MLRNIVFLLIGSSLLVPPGTCVCRLVEGGQSTSRFSESRSSDVEDGCCPDGCCHHGSHNGSPAGSSKGVPDGKRCPIHCPANTQVDHSKLFEQHHPAPLLFGAIVPLGFVVELTLVQRLRPILAVSQRSAPLLYLLLCTLLI